MPMITFAELPKAKLEIDREKVLSNAMEAIDSGNVYANNYRPDLSTSDGVSVWQMALFILGNAPQLIKLMYQLIKVFTMDNDKMTTFLATFKIAVGIVAMVLSMFKITMPDEISNAFIGAAGSLYLIFDWIIGFFTNKKDKPVV